MKSEIVERRFAVVEEDLSSLYSQFCTLTEFIEHKFGKLTFHNALSSFFSY